MIPVGPMQGRIVRDPDFEFIGQSKFPKWSATLAVDEPRYNGQTRESEVVTIWVRLQAVGDMAEDLANANYGRGDELAVTGRLGQYLKDLGDGKKEDKTHVIPLHVTCTRRSARRQQAAPPPQPAGNDPWATDPAADRPPF